MAQVAEHILGKDEVTSSNLVSSSNHRVLAFYWITSERQVSAFWGSVAGIRRSIEVVITARTRNAVVPKGARGFESHLLRHMGVGSLGSTSILEA